MAKVKEKILVACNTLTSVQLGPYVDHMRAFYRMGRDYPRIEFHQFFARRMSIDRFRNQAAQIARDGGMDYLLFIDDDMQFGPEVFTLLYKERKKFQVLAALNYIRGYPFDPMAFKYQTLEKGGVSRLIFLKDEEIDAAEGKVIKCDAIGTSLCLIDSKVFHKTPAPWFITGPYNTEDIYFSIKVKKYNPKIKIGVHTGAITGHVLDPEVLSYHNRKHLQSYFESYGFKKPSDDRGCDYLNMVEEMLGSTRVVE